MEKLNLKPGQITRIVSDAFQLYHNSLKSTGSLYAINNDFNATREIEDYATQILNLGWEIEKLVRKHYNEIDSDFIKIEEQ
jgi:hypothetical protein